MVKVQIAIFGLYALAAFLIWVSFGNWYLWAKYGQYINLFWVILFSFTAAIAAFQASILVLQIVDSWNFMRKAKKKLEE